MGKKFQNSIYNIITALYSGLFDWVGIIIIRVFRVADGKRLAIRPSHAWPSVTGLPQWYNILHQYRYINGQLWPFCIQFNALFYFFLIKLASPVHLWQPTETVSARVRDLDSLRLMIVCDVWSLCGRITTYIYNNITYLKTRFDHYTQNCFNILIGSR